MQYSDTTPLPYEGPNPNTRVFVHDYEDKFGFAVPALSTFLLFISLLLTAIGLVLYVVVTREIPKKTVFGPTYDHVWLYILVAVFALCMWGISLMTTLWTAQRRFSYLLVQVVVLILIIGGVSFFFTATVLLIKDDIYWTNYKDTCHHVEPFYRNTFCSEIHAALHLLVAGSILTLISSILMLVWAGYCVVRHFYENYLITQQTAYERIDISPTSTITTISTPISTAPAATFAASHRSLSERSPM